MTEFLKSREYAAMALRVAVVLAVTLVLAGMVAARPKSMAEEMEGDAYRPIGLTEEEKGMLDQIGALHRSTPPAVGPVRQPGEFEPMTGIIVRYPFGNPTNLLVEYAEDTMLWVIVANSSQQTTVYNTLQAAGADMAHVDFILAPTNSIWTRDYGPWFIIDGDGDQGIVDPIYNRPRPQDDLIPGVIGSDWGIPVYGMDVAVPGGNYMSDGRGVAMSTRLVLDENSGFTEAEIDSIFEDYLGIERYEVLPYIETGGIHHIDCWGKLLSPSKVLVREVPPTHSSYSRIEANVAYLESTESSYGTPYEVVRVWTPYNEPYTNSLIVNNKVYVPMWGNSNDALALQAYRDAMPGYEIQGYTGSWVSNDAIHCRAMGVTDRYMLHIDHVPTQSSTETRDGHRIDALIVDHSEAGLKPDSLLVYWKTDLDPGFTPILMVPSAREDAYYAEIPLQSIGTTVSYYVFAADYSGRRESHPYVAPGDVHSFEVVPTGIDDSDAGAPRFALEQNKPNPFNPATTIAFELPLGGRTELSVYNAAGQRVTTLLDEELNAGRHTITWRGLDESGGQVASGVYFFRLSQGEESVSRKGVLLK